MYMGNPPVGYYGAPQPMNQFTDPNNTMVFVGGLSGYVTEDDMCSFSHGLGDLSDYVTEDELCSFFHGFGDPCVYQKLCKFILQSLTWSLN